MSGLVLVAVFLLAGAYSMNPYIAVAMLSLCFGFTQFTEGAFWSASTYAAGPHTSTATGVMNTGGNAAGFLAPVVGMMVDQLGLARDTRERFRLRSDRRGAVALHRRASRRAITGALGSADRIDPLALGHLGAVDADEMAVRQ